MSNPRVLAPGDRPHRAPAWDPRAELPLRLAALVTAEWELRAGVREIGLTNTGERVELYQEAAEIPAGSPWCAAFLNWAAEEAAQLLGTSSPLEDVPLQGYVQSYVNHGQAEGWEITYQEAGPGDLFCLWFPSLSRWAHIGFVRWKLDENRYVTIEGNTSKGDAQGAADRDSAWVASRTRRTGSRVTFLRWAP